MTTLTWVSFSPILSCPDGSRTSELASTRYRILIPIAHLPAERYQSRIASIVTPEVDPQVKKMLEADIVIFSKSILPIETLAKHAHEVGAKVIFDICDHHFEDAKYAARYRAMADLADLVTCNTETMAQVASRYTKTPCAVIEDPVEGEQKPPSFVPKQPLRLLWFGHPSNLDSLDAVIPSLFEVARTTPLVLSILTRLAPEIIQHAARVSGGRLQVRCAQWSLPAQWHELEQADAVIIPSIPTAQKLVKSSNRIAETLRAGRMAIAQPVPSYEPFRPFAWIGDDIGEGIAWMLANPDEIPGRIATGQRHIEAILAPRLVVAKWGRVFEELLNRSAMSLG